MQLDPVSLEVLKGQLRAITDEMGVALQRASYSPNIKTRKDHTCSLFDARLEMVAQTAHQIGHLGAFPYIMKTTMREHRVEDLRPGDQIIVNDPYRGGTHIPDIIMLAPVFVGERLWGYVANLAHHTDVGGMTPGSMPGNATEIFQEGLRIPSVKLFRGGALQHDLLKLILANVRTPEERKGDLAAQVAANNLGARRVQQLVARYGFDTLAAYAAELIAYAERRMRAELARIPDGEYAGVDYLDDDGVDERPIKNCTYYQTMSLVMYTLRCLTDPDIPQNEGIYKPVRLVVPSGRALNAQFPAAVAAGWEISRRTIDALCRALQAAIPDRVPAGSNGAMNQFSFGGRRLDGSHYAYYETHGGGFGARPTKDGMDGVHSVSNTMNTPIEELELFYPLVVRRYALRVGSEGAGRYRGGLGLARELEFLTDATLSVISDREVHRPWGIAGGEEAAGSDFRVVSASAERRLGTKAVARITAGERVLINTAGGGGFGRPRERDREALARDVADGKVAAERARAVYGWEGPEPRLRGAWRRGSPPGG
ncbi:MAG: hydantoinase B/oxoprolinase family protein [Chloroflexi bacterium]|nr:hydantoinase B/oxoprolinase family protein [Chloroflexota bacterium]